MNAAPNINNFDDVHLCCIFQWLSQRDLAAASGVCLRWRNVTRDFTLWKPFTQKELIHIPKPLATPFWEHYSKNARGLKFRSVKVVRGEAISAWGKTITVWQRHPVLPHTYECKQTTTSHTGTITCFALRQIGLTHLVITGSADTTLKVHTSSPHNLEYHELQTLRGHTSCITRIACFSHYILSATSEGKGCLWTYKTQDRQFSAIQLNIELDSQGINILEGAAHIQQFITVGKGNSIKFWSIDHGKKLICRDQFKIEGEVITSAVYCHFQPTLLLGTESGKILVYGKRSSINFHCQAIFEGHREGVAALNIAGRDRYLLSAGRDRKIKVWDLKSESPLLSHSNTIDIEEKSISSLEGTISNQSGRLHRLLYPTDGFLRILQFLPNQINRYAVTAAEPFEQKKVSTEMDVNRT